MTAAAPWSVKGIDPKAREMAKDLARRSGMTLGEWLNQMILEEDAEAAPGEGMRATASVHTLHAPAGADRSAAAMSGLEAALDRATAQLRQGEERALAALEAVRRDMDGVAETLNDKITDSAYRNKATVDRLAADLARIDRTLDARLRRADKTQAEALETLGAEVARIVERLADRIAKAERRSAEATDEVAERMGRFTDRLERGQERVLVDVAERLRQAEARCALMLQDAQDRVAAAARPESAPPQALVAPTEAIYLESPADFDMAEAFPQGGSATETQEDLVLSAEWEAARVRTASIREMLASARAAALEDHGSEFVTIEPDPSAAPKSVEHGRRKKDGSVVRTALLTSGVVAALGVTATYVMSHADLIGGWTKAPPTKANGPVRRQPAAPAPAAEPPSAAKPAIPPAAADGPSLLAQAKSLIVAGDPSGLGQLTKAANLDYAPAQFYLAQLYEQGGAGLNKDPAEARRWTARAAGNGEPKAMHNLGLYYFHGEGGAKDPAAAAVWFGKAAELGLVDSQYNLAQLYAQGQGVARNPAEAYKWLLIAARAGDAEAETAAERLKVSLTTGERQAAERDAAAFKPRSGSPG